MLCWIRRNEYLGHRTPWSDNHHWLQFSGSSFPIAAYLLLAFHCQQHHLHSSKSPLISLSAKCIRNYWPKVRRDFATSRFANAWEPFPSLHQSLKWGPTYINHCSIHHDFATVVHCGIQKWTENTSVKSFNNLHLIGGFFWMMWQALAKYWNTILPFLAMPRIG